jgi:tetratricopeptide (TPR) repeat protein
MANRAGKWLVCAAAIALASAWTPEANAARNRHLAKAKKAFDDLDYGKVLPLLKKALKIAKQADEEVEIYELMAIIHATYSRDAKARDAFEEVLRRRPDYQLPPNTSPKIESALEEARDALTAEVAARGRVEEEEEVAVGRDEVVPLGDTDLTGDSAPVADVAAKEAETAAGRVVIAATEPMPLLTAQRRRTALYEEWWFWTIVGGVLVAGGVGSGVYAYSQSGPPRYDLGPVPVR